MIVKQDRNLRRPSVVYGEGIGKSDGNDQNTRENVPVFTDQHRHKAARTRTSFFKQESTAKRQAAPTTTLEYVATLAQGCAGRLRSGREHSKITFLRSE